MPANGRPPFSSDDIHAYMPENVTIKSVKHIGIALFDSFALCETASVIELFQSANALVSCDRGRAAPYQVYLLSSAGGCVASSSSVNVWTESVDTPRHVRHFQVLFVAGGAGVQHSACDRQSMEWLRRTGERAGLVYAIAEGHQLLEGAGFRCAQAGWCIDEQASVGGRTILRAPTTHEVSPAIRAALGIIQEDLGGEIVCPIPHDIMSPALTQLTDMICRTATRDVSEKIRAAARWLEANGNQPLAIGRAAEAAAMSGRNFLRRFKAEMGVTPCDYLLHLRLDRCCRLLVETRLPVDKIARRCGVGSGGRLARLFRRHLGKTPTDYRAIQRRSGEFSEGD